MITINKIAELAGVSRGTVDRVINKRGGVSQFVEKRVAGIIDQYGYKPNKVARALVKSRKLHSIGVVSTSAENVFFVDVARGVRRAERDLEDLGVAVRYCEVSKFSAAEQVACINEMLRNGVDALAVNPIYAPVVKEKLAEAIGRGVPVITFNSDIEGIDRLAYIGCDYRKSGRIAAGLLAMASGGKAGVAIVTGSAKILGQCLRVKGARDELRRRRDMRIVEVVEMFDDDITSYSRVKELLAKNGGVDAFFFAAVGKEGGIRAIAEARRGRMPLIVTVDLDPFTCECIRNGTVMATICQQPFQQGYEAVRQLADYLMHGDRPARQMQYTQPEIVIRQSLE